MNYNINRTGHIPTFYLTRYSLKSVVLLRFFFKEIGVVIFFSVRMVVRVVISVHLELTPIKTVPVNVLNALQVNSKDRFHSLNFRIGFNVITNGSLV